MPIEYHFSGLLIKMENNRGHDRERSEISTYVYIYIHIHTHRWHVNHHRFMQGRDDACSLLLFSSILIIILITIILIIVILVIITSVITASIATIIRVLGFLPALQSFSFLVGGCAAQWQEPAV